MKYLFFVGLLFFSVAAYAQLGGNPDSGFVKGQTKYTYFISITDSLKNYSSSADKYIHFLNLPFSKGENMILCMESNDFTPAIYVLDSAQQKPVHGQSQEAPYTSPLAVINYTPFTGKYVFLLTSKEQNKKGAFHATLVLPKAKSIPGENASFCEKLDYILAMLPLNFAFVTNGKEDELGFTPTKIQLVKDAREHIMHTVIGANYISSYSAEDKNDMEKEFNELEKQLSSCLGATHQHSVEPESTKYIRSISFTTQGPNEPVELNGPKTTALALEKQGTMTGAATAYPKNSIVLSMSSNKDMFGTAYSVTLFIY